MGLVAVETQLYYLHPLAVSWSSTPNKAQILNVKGPKTQM